MLWSLVRPLLFQGDAETTHERTVSALERLGRSEAGRALLRTVARQHVIPGGSAREVWNLRFRSPVGLAAGFDKNGVLLRALPHLGFGFAEIGSVTPRPQPGNPRPRLSRDASRKAIWNAMGFNNDGIEVVAARLEQARGSGWIPSDFPVGVNLGKNKDTPNEVAHRDYLAGARRFMLLADYLVVNVSSPNTPGLRALQEPEGVRRILDPILEVRAGGARSVPVLLKLAPEISGTLLAELLRQLEDRVDGWILTNTLQSNSGGLSGEPLAEFSRARLLEAVGQTSKPIISVGGILDAHEARGRIEAGASLIQAYAGYIYGGPAFPARVAAGLFEDC
jgi:dihydroorotate dehydrogenase